MAKQKACKICSTIHELEKCPKCESRESTEGFKGRVIILDPEKSEIAQKLKTKKKGNFAIKVNKAMAKINEKIITLPRYWFFLTIQNKLLKNIINDVTVNKYGKA